MNYRAVPYDEVLTPLGPDARATRHAAHVNPLVLASILVVAAIMGVVGWISVAGDPDAGESYVVLALSTLEPLSDSDSEVLMAVNGVPLPQLKPIRIAESGLALTATPAAVAAVALPPMLAYAVPFPANDPRPRVAVVLRGLGLSTSATELAITTLPANVTLSFVPYAKNLQAWVDRARAAGHEVLLEIPMEPLDATNSDPGPYTLTTGVTAAENIERLEWLMRRFTGYVGVTNYLGSKFTQDAVAFEPVLASLRERGVLYLDDGTSGLDVLQSAGDDTGIVWSLSDRELTYASAAAVDLDLSDLEAVAQERASSAIGTGFAFPVTIERVTAWAATLEAKGIALAPLTAIVAPPH